MLNESVLGKTVALTSCRAYGYSGREITISGLWIVEEFHPYEPSAYVHSACFTVCRPWTTGDSGFTVDADDLWEQIDPKGYGRLLRQERECELAMEYADNHS